MDGDVLRKLISRWRDADKEAGGLSDAQLLERFIAMRDEAAFEVLVWRHGGLVLGVARRWLGCTPDAEDAFQATFLTLARKAATIRRHAALAAWLHQVVYRIAIRARKRRVRRELLEQPLADRDMAAASAQAGDDLLAILDTEVGRLSEKHRRAVLMCYFQGYTTAAAAQILGCPRGTVLSRLAAARELLQRRLGQRGLARVALAGLAIGSAAEAPAANLIAASVRAGLELPILVSEQVLSMSNGVIQTMFWKKLGMIAATLAVLAVCGVGLGWAGHGEQPSGGTTPAHTEKTQPPPTEKAKPAEAPPAEPPDRAKVELLKREVELARADAELQHVEAKTSQVRMDARRQMIEIEERMRELEFRHTWQREQQKQALQNLEASLRDRSGQLPTVQAAVRNLEVEVARAKEIAKLVEAGQAPQNARFDLQVAVRNHETQMALEKQLRPEIASLEEKIAKCKIQALEDEQVRTQERIQMRQELAEAEEQIALLERKQARQVERATAAYGQAAEQLAEVKNAPAGRVHELERKVDALQRELSELRRQIQRSPAKPD